MATWGNADVIRVTCRLRSATGEDIENVYHYVCDFAGEVEEEDCITDILAQMDSMYDTIQPEIPSDVTFVDIDIMNVVREYVYAARPWPNQTVGGGTGDTMPEQNCALVVGRTNRTKTVGRKFLGPFIEAANNDGAWRSTLTAMLADYIDQYLADIVVGLSQRLVPGVAHYFNNVFQRFTEFSEAYTSSGVYTQRRRRRGVGS